MCRIAGRCAQSALEKMLHCVQRFFLGIQPLYVENNFIYIGVKRSRVIGATFQWLTTEKQSFPDEMFLEKNSKIKHERYILIRFFHLFPVCPGEQIFHDFKVFFFLPALSVINSQGKCHLRQPIRRCHVGPLQPIGSLGWQEKLRRSQHEEERSDKSAVLGFKNKQKV